MGWKEQSCEMVLHRRAHPQLRLLSAVLEAAAVTLNLRVALTSCCYHLYLHFMVEA